MFVLSKEGQILSGDHWMLDASRVKHYGWLEVVSLLFEISRHNDVCSFWLSVCMPAWWYKYLLTGVWPVALFILIQMHSLQNVLHKLPRLFPPLPTSFLLNRSEPEVVVQHRHLFSPVAHEAFDGRELARRSEWVTLCFAHCGSMLIWSVGPREAAFSFQKWKCWSRIVTSA